MDSFQTLYTVMIVTFPFCLPLIVVHDHLPIPLGSSPCLVTLGCNIVCGIIWFPPGLYVDDHGMIDSELYVDDPFNCFLISLLKDIQAR